MYYKILHTSSLEKAYEWADTGRHKMIIFADISSSKLVVLKENGYHSPVLLRIVNWIVGKKIRNHGKYSEYHLAIKYANFKWLVDRIPSTKLQILF